MNKLTASLLFLFLFSYSFAFGQEELITLKNREQYYATKKGNEEVKETNRLLLNTKAADFKFRTLKGDSVQLSKLRGKVVVINVFHIFCGSCTYEMHAINKIVKYYGNEDIIFLAISTYNTSATIYDLQKRLELKGMASMYHNRVKVIPASYLGKIGDGFILDTSKISKEYKNVTLPVLEQKYMFDAETSNYPRKYFIDKQGVIRFISYDNEYKKYDYYPLYTDEIDKLLAEEYKKQ